MSFVGLYEFWLMGLTLFWLFDVLEVLSFVGLHGIFLVTLLLHWVSFFFVIWTLVDSEIGDDPVCLMVGYYFYPTLDMKDELLCAWMYPN